MILSLTQAAGCASFKLAMANNPRLHKAEPQLDTSGDLMQDLQDALADKVRGMSEHAIARKHGVSKERLRHAVKTPQGSQLMRRIKREMRLPDKLGKEELLHKIKLWIEREEVKADSKLADLVGAAMNYAKLAGYLDKCAGVQVNQVQVIGTETFGELLKRVKSSENCPTNAIDV